ncbi:hypothetical protein A0J61_07258 [Choanephora cucurbitarum]|uniref:Uncharacterized protein n=2 Tax=Choanephora cucurbitarum TaxID=101091 RepID=A0A1C7N7U3_9FUNG|nr:hypothetical protein A0J61_07258 [Choanephora cucurbitarum]
MTVAERSLLVRWRLGWLPGGKPRPCTCGHSPLTKKHISLCLFFHLRLHVPTRVADPISYILNRLPKKRPTKDSSKRYWQFIWPSLINLLLQVDRIQHATSSPLPRPQHATVSPFLQWIAGNS